MKKTVINNAEFLNALNSFNSQPETAAETETTAAEPEVKTEEQADRAEATRLWNVIASAIIARMGKPARVKTRPGSTIEQKAINKKLKDAYLNRGPYRAATEPIFFEGSVNININDTDNSKEELTMTRSTLFNVFTAALAILATAPRQIKWRAIDLTERTKRRAADRRWSAILDEAAVFGKQYSLISLFNHGDSSFDSAFEEVDSILREQAEYDSIINYAPEWYYIDRMLDETGLKPEFAGVYAEPCRACASMEHPLQWKVQEDIVELNNDLVELLDIIPLKNRPDFESLFYMYDMFLKHLSESRSMLDYLFEYEELRLIANCAYGDANELLRIYREATRVS